MVRKLSLLTIILIIFLAITIPVIASEYSNGYVTPGGYTYQNGYWYYDSIAYNRTQVWYPAGYYNNCYNAGYWYWSYTKANISNTYNTNTYNTVPVDWRTQLLDLAKQRDTAELGLRKSALEQIAYLESINALGLTGNFRIQNYGQAIQFPGYAGGMNYASVNQGNTLYGYSYNTVKEAYGSTDMNVLYQQASRLTQGAQQLAGDAHRDFSGLVTQAGDNQSRIAEILAKAAAAEKVLNAANPQPSTRTTTTVTGSGSTSTVMPKVDDTLVEDTKRFLTYTGIPLCGSCHSGQTLKGKFDILTYPTMTSDQKNVIWDRIFSKDPDKVMPRSVDGRPGTPLTAAQKQDFVTH